MNSSGVSRSFLRGTQLTSKQLSRHPIPCFAKPRYRQSALSPRCSLEAQKHFVKRLEAQGWEAGVRDHSKAHPLVHEAWAAMDHIYGVGVLETALEASPWLHAAMRSSGGSVHLKLENRQVTGSFKARGAAHKLLSLTPEQRTAGIVTSSTGNHALAVLHAVAALQSAGRPVAAKVYVPKTIAPQKAAKLQTAAKTCGAEIVAIGEDCIEAEGAARAEAEATGKVYVSPYNDLSVAGGQGTVALEILMSLPAERLDAVFVPVGGGGLISGIAAVLKSIDPAVKVIGCQPSRSDVMRQSVLAGKVVDLPWQDTLSDGTAGGIEEGSITLEPCQQFVDEWICVEEDAIATAMVGVHGHHGMGIEGSAGVAVASFLKVADRMQGKHVVIVACGGNVAAATLDAAYEMTRQRSMGSMGSIDEMSRGPAAAF